jgi:hypothetical protein
MCGEVCLLISVGQLIESHIILAVSFGQFEAAEGNSIHMSWDVSYPDVSCAIPRDIIPYEVSRLLEIRNTKITNVKTESALLLVNYATECALVATYMGWIVAKITFAGASVITFF